MVITYPENESDPVAHAILVLAEVFNEKLEEINATLDNIKDRMPDSVPSYN